MYILFVSFIDGLATLHGAFHISKWQLCMKGPPIYLSHLFFLSPCMVGAIELDIDDGQQYLWGEIDSVFVWYWSQVHVD